MALLPQRECDRVHLQLAVEHLCSAVEALQPQGTSPPPSLPPSSQFQDQGPATGVRAPTDQSNSAEAERRVQAEQLVRMACIWLCTTVMALGGGEGQSVISDGHTPSFGADSAAKSGSRSVRIALDSLRQEFRDQKRGVKLEKGLLVGGCIRLIHMQLSARNNAHVETQRAKLCGSEDVNEGRGEGENGEALGELVVDVCLSHARMLLRLGRASQDGADGCKAYGSLDQAGTQKSGDVRAFGEEWRLLPASALVLSALTQHDKQPADWQQLSAAAHHPDPTDQHSSQTTFHPLSRAVLARAHDALLRLVDGKLLHLMAAMVVCALPAAPPLSPPSTFTRLLGGMASILNQMEAQLDDGGVMAFGAATCHVLRCPHLPGSVPLYSCACDALPLRPKTIS